MRTRVEEMDAGLRTYRERVRQSNDGDARHIARHRPLLHVILSARHIIHTSYYHTRLFNHTSQLPPAGHSRKCPTGFHVKTPPPLDGKPPPPPPPPPPIKTHHHLMGSLHRYPHHYAHPHPHQPNRQPIPNPHLIGILNPNHLDYGEKGHVKEREGADEREGSDR